MPPAHPPQTAPEKAGGRLLIGIVLLAAILRILFIGTKSLWLDEAASVAFARMDWPAFWHTLATREANMGLYYLLLRGWMHLGDTEAVLRGLSLIFSLATIPVVFVLGTRLFGRRVGLLAALLLALNAFHVRFAQEARGYSLVALLVTLSSLFFVAGVEGRSRRAWAGYVLASALAVYAHFFAALVIIAHWVSLVFLDARRAPWKTLMLATASVAILVLPLGIFAATRDAGQIDWIPEPGAAHVYRLFYTLAGSVVLTDTVGGNLLLAGYVALGAAALIAGARTWSSPAGMWRYGLVLSWLFVPVGLVLAASLVKPLLVYRYLIVCLPALVLLAAIGLSAIRARPVAAVVLAAVVALALRGTGLYYARYEREDWRSVARHIRASAVPGDAMILHEASARLPYDYYTRRWSGRPAIAYPSADLFAEQREPGDVTKEVPAAARRVWLVLAYVPPTGSTRDAARALQEGLAGRFRSVTEKRFARIRIYLYQ